MKNHNFMYILICYVFLGITASCKEESNTPEYSGKVLTMLTDCSSETGAPYTIAVNNVNNTPQDTIATVTLPEQFKIAGTTINFKIRELKQNDAHLACNTNIIIPDQVVVYDITSANIN